MSKITAKCRKFPNTSFWFLGRMKCFPDSVCLMLQPGGAAIQVGPMEGNTQLSRSPIMYKNFSSTAPLRTLTCPDYRLKNFPTFCKSCKDPMMTSFKYVLFKILISISRLLMTPHLPDSPKLFFSSQSSD